MKTLGKYELLEEIASGGMGKICRARDRVLHREVAIKTIFTGQTDPEVKQRFYREARACAILSHPNIVTVFDLGEQQGTSYIAMEFLEGEDLRRFIDRRGTMSLEAKIAFMAEVCDGLAHAHESGIVHRDIKPGNIFVTKSGRPKILDFGVARITASRLTQPGTPLGTPRYMAPEQYLGKEVDTLSDLFSACVVFLEFLTCVHPFDSPDAGKGVPEEAPGAGPTARWSAADVPGRIVKEEPLSLRGLNPVFPERLEKILAKGLSKDPQLRYQTASDLARELRKVTVDLVRECSKLWNEVLDHRKHILELESAAGDFLPTSWVQTVLKKANVDLNSAEKLKPDSSATVLSDLHYLDLVSQLDEIKRMERLLEQVAEDVAKARQDSVEAGTLLQNGNIEGAAKIMRPLSERFPDHVQISSLMQEVRLRSSAAALEKALADNNLVNALEFLNDIQAIGSTNPESVALLESLRSRVGDAMAAKDLLCESIRATLQQMRAASTGDDAQRIEMLSSSLDELTQELKHRYSAEKMPGEIRELVSACDTARNEALLQIARIRLRAALVQGDLLTVRKSLQTIKELCADNPGYESCLGEAQKEVVESVLVADYTHAAAPAANLSIDAPTQISLARDRELKETPAQVTSGATSVPATPATIVPGAGSEAVTQITPLRSRICPSCGAANNSANTHCFRCSAALAETPSGIPPAPEKSPWGSDQTPSGTFQAVYGALLLCFRRLSPLQRKVVPALAAIVLLIPLLYVALHSSEKRGAVPVVVGKAQVLGAEIPLRGEARDDARLVAKLSAGEPVEILNGLPTKVFDGWISVRRQGGQPAAGFVRMNQLICLETGFSEFDLWHARYAIPDAGKSDPAELRQRLNNAEGTLARLAEGPESVQLQLKLADGYAQLAHRALPDHAAAKEDAERAERILGRLKDMNVSSPEVDKVRASLDSVAKATASTQISGGAKTSPPPPVAGTNAASVPSARTTPVSELLKKATADFDAGQYAEVESLCGKILSSYPQNREAADLMKKATAARKLKERLLKPD